MMVFQSSFGFCCVGKNLAKDCLEIFLRSGNGVQLERIDQEFGDSRGKASR